MPLSRLIDEEIWINASDEIEIENTPCSAAMSRRMLMARWLSDAWADLTTNYSHPIESAFVKTGFKVTKDGSEDHLIEIQGWGATEPYTYRD